MTSDHLHPCHCEARSVAEQQLTACVCLDTELRVTYMNPAAEMLFAIGAKKAATIPFAQIVQIPEIIQDRLDDVLRHERRFTKRAVSLSKPGHEEPIVVDCTISPYISENEKHGLLLEFHSVDQQIRIARENAMLSQQEISRSLLRGLAHEIKNPLGGLRGAAQLLARELDSDEREYTDIIIREADRLHALIDRMLGPNQRPKLSAVNIHEVLEYVRKLTLAEASPSINITADYDPSIPSFQADRDHFVQVFLNITRNAVQALDGKGNITYRTRVKRYITIGRKLHKLVGIFQIIDDGPGIPPDILDSIFYPMITGRADGTGLGLSIAQSLINQQGGLIECESVPGRTAFKILVPLEVHDDG
ncbi:nitrogen regulation protein NR(II) [Granulosicoccaceae sp. 1_MG-2023]|nr:nitrogen regulation protein NR(II) [Granulosicoccaceae sp. 1_MG-2023]